METLTDKIVNWISQQSAEKPFFVYFTPVAVHNPITPSKATAGKSKGRPFARLHQRSRPQRGARARCAGAKKASPRTLLVIFTSDNGGVNKPENANLVQTGCAEGQIEASGGPFRGGKHDVWEGGGFRVPYLVRWPGHVPAGTVCDETISIVDTLASGEDRVMPCQRSAKARRTVTTSRRLAR